MNFIIAWLAKNPVIANLLMGISLLAGFAAIDRIPVTDFPDIDALNIVVNVPYLGAAPEDVDTAVCARIQEQLRGVTGVEGIASTANENFCNVLLELMNDVDGDSVLSEVQALVNSIESFPEDTEKPIISLVAPSTITAEIAVIGPSDERALKELGRIVRDDLLLLPEVDQARITDTRPYEIHLEISEISLRRNNLTFDQVANAVRRSSVDLPGGSIKTAQGELLLRTTGQAYVGAEFENLTVGARADGTRILFKDVGKVVDGFADAGSSVLFNGQPAALIEVYQVGPGDIREIGAAVREFLAEAPQRYPEGVELVLWEDSSRIVQNRLSSLIDSGLQGLLLILLLLSLFLRPSLGLWVAAGIPIALMGAVFLLYWMGYSLDQVSLIGFILALGMVVDDAVVVGEQVFVEQKNGGSQLQAATAGAQRVLMPVLFGVLTTIAMFMPLLFAEGAMGALMRGMAAALIACLIFSLIECKMILPAHLAHQSERMPLGEFGLTLMIIAVLAAFTFSPNLRAGVAASVMLTALILGAHRSGLLGRLAVAFASWQIRFEGAIQYFIENRFRSWVDACLRNRGATLATAFAVFAFAVGLAGSGRLPFAFMLPLPGDRVIAQVTMPPGVDRSATERAVGQLRTAVEEVERQVLAEFGVPAVEHIVESFGGHESTAARSAVLNSTNEVANDNLAQIALQLVASGARPITPEEYAERWREATGSISGAEKLVYLSNRLDAGTNIEIRIFGNDVDQLRMVSAEIRRRLAEFGGVFNIADDFVPGKEEIRLSITPAGESLGLSLADLGSQVRQAFYGEEAQRVQRGLDDIRVMVRYTEEERRSLQSLYDLRIRTAQGNQVPFSTVAEVESGVGQSSINRESGMRAITVTANVDPTLVSANEVIRELDTSYLRLMERDFPRIGYNLESIEYQREFRDSVGMLYLFAALSIFALLALPLKSFYQPWLILAVAPFTFVGAMFGHLVMSWYGNVIGISFPSYLGVIGAVGVAINANLILLNEMNGLRAAGQSMRESVASAAVSRCRPVLMTSATTFIGLVPLMFTFNPAASAMVPMVVAMGWGIMFAAAASLFVMPALWLQLDYLGDSIKRGTARARSLTGGASRLNSWVARFPYIQESLQSREFTDLSLPDDLEFASAAEEKIARQGLVRMYYALEFGPEQMREQLDEYFDAVGNADDLAGEVKIWAQKRVFQLGIHMESGRIEPASAAGPLSDIIGVGCHFLQRAVKRDMVAHSAGIAEGCHALIASGSFGRREFAAGDKVEFMFLHDRAAIDRDQEEFQQRLARLIALFSSEGMLFGEAEFFSLPVDRGTTQACPLQDLRGHFGGNPPPADLRWMAQARVLAADGELGREFEALRAEVMAAPRDFRELSSYVANRRAKLPGPEQAGRGKIPAGRGGLADLELAADYLCLSGTPRPRGDEVPGLAAIFKAAAGGPLQADEATQLAAAAEMWQNFDGFAKMVFGDGFDLAGAPAKQRRIITKFFAASEFGEVSGIISETARRTATQLDRLSGRNGSPASAGK